MTYYLILPILNNQTIIVIAIESKLFNAKSIKLINMVWIRLQVIFLSDIVEIGTSKVRRNISEVEKDRYHRSVYD